MGCSNSGGLPWPAWLPGLLVAVPVPSLLPIPHPTTSTPPLIENQPSNFCGQNRARPAVLISLPFALSLSTSTKHQAPHSKISRLSPPPQINTLVSTSPSLSTTANHKYSFQLHFLSVGKNRNGFYWPSGPSKKSILLLANNRFGPSQPTLRRPQSHHSKPKHHQHPPFGPRKC